MIRQILYGIYNFFKTQNLKRKALKAVYNSKLNTYYPEKELKTDKEQKNELVGWAKRYHEFNAFYTLYGLDVKENSQAEDYIDYLSFMNSRNKINRIGCIDCSVALLRDKFLFYKYMRGCGLPVPDVFCLIDNGVFYDENYNQITEDSLFGNSDFFIKEIDGECASFVKHIANWKDIHCFDDKINNGKFILQRRVYQAQEMNCIYPGSINTYRIVTINKNGEPYVLTSILRVGTSKSGNVDNWAAGGLALGIDNETGNLKKWGYYKPQYGTKTSEHPDTGVVFEETTAPSYQEAVRIAIDAARRFYGVRAIGWDIAITENGPIFIEGNDNWEISLNQACDRPLKKDWLDAIN